MASEEPTPEEQEQVKARVAAIIAAENELSEESVQQAVIQHWQQRVVQLRLRCEDLEKQVSDLQAELEKKPAVKKQVARKR